MFHEPETPAPPVCPPHSPVQVLEECMAEIDRREADVGACTVINAAAPHAAAEASDAGEQKPRFRRSTDCPSA